MGAVHEFCDRQCWKFLSTFSNDAKTFVTFNKISEPEITQLTYTPRANKIPSSFMNFIANVFIFPTREFSLNANFCFHDTTRHETRLLDFSWKAPAKLLIKDNYKNISACGFINYDRIKILIFHLFSHVFHFFLMFIENEIKLNRKKVFRNARRLELKANFDRRQ